MKQAFPETIPRGSKMPGATGTQRAMFRMFEKTTFGLSNTMNGFQPKSTAPKRYSKRPRTPHQHSLVRPVTSSERLLQ